MNLGEKRFAWLLKQRHIPFSDETTLHERIDVGKTRPDFYAEPPGMRPFLVEVEGLQKPGPFRCVRSRLWAPDPDANLKRLRRPVELAARQLKPYESLSIPMVVVLDNARRVGVSLDSIDLIQLFGMVEFRVPVNTTTGEPAGRAYLHHGSKQVLTPTRRRYVSAIAVNLPKRDYEYVEPLEKERPMRLRVIHNPYALVRLPFEIFTDPEDEHIGLDDGRWVNLRTECPLTNA